MLRRNTRRNTTYYEAPIVLRFQAVVDVDTNTAANAKQVHDEITRLLQALAEKGWRVTVWPVSERERE